jgi:acetylornithine/succinyldiaminopimelate/putrescine aminotransferase
LKSNSGNQQFALALSRRITDNSCFERVFSPTAGRDRGLSLNAARPDLLRFLPALNGTREETDTLVGLLEQTRTDLEI